MLSNNVPATFSVEESDFLSGSGQSRLNFSAHLLHSLMENRCYFIKRLMHSVYKEFSGGNVS